MGHQIHEGQRAGVAQLLADDKAFGWAMARLIAYVRRYAEPAHVMQEGRK